jgi:hypothetical protein
MTICMLGDLARYTFIRAEDVQTFPPNGHYSDLLKFEIDVAQIAHLVLVFCESSGSFSELGAFCMDQEIVQRLLVAIDDGKYAKDSFIRHGPLKFLEDEYPDTAVLVLKTAEIGLGPGS